MGSPGSPGRVWGSPTKGTDMKRFRTVAIWMLPVIAIAALAAAGDLQPATVDNDCYRTASGSALSGTYWRNTTLRMTNWVCYSDATGTTTQSLTDVVVTVDLGNATASTEYTGTVYLAASGMFTCDVTVPTNTGSQYIQVTLTDTGQSPNVVFTYPWYSIVTQDRIGD